MLCGAMGQCKNNKERQSNSDCDWDIHAIDQIRDILRLLRFLWEDSFAVSCRLVARSVCNMSAFARNGRDQADLSAAIIIIVTAQYQKQASLLELARMKQLLSVFFVFNILAQISGKIFHEVYYEFGSNLGSTIPTRVLSHLQSMGVPVSPYSDDVKSALSESSLVLSFGDAALSKTFVSLEDVSSEGFRLESAQYASGSTLLACDGLPINPNTRQFALDVNNVHLGAAYCVYASLELLGFAFLHPLSPYRPPNPTLTDTISRSENPFWEKRTWHIHTQHPLEFTDVLNGYDIPMFDEDGKSSTCPKGAHCESWEDMFSTLEGLFEWLVANRQNRVEVLLLGNDKWEKWNNMTTGSVRQDRLRRINGLSHEYGILIGADIPLANLQQHGMAMVSMRDDLATQTTDIQAAVDWAMLADFDFVSTESGLSEFTKPTCELMLQLFEVLTERVHVTWKREALTKVHCSTDQKCNDVDEETGELKYPDPRTGEPINFNFLPTYASEGLGVMAHTVQVYSFDDPTAGAYGNNNFSYMSDYMMFESGASNRDVLYYGETAYWVNVDVDVPLFLPLSGQRRLYDLRKTAHLELQNNLKTQGQMNFESGWEFGYYLSNVVTARAAWDPLLSVSDDWLAFRLALRPVVSMFGEYAESVTNAIVDLSKVQADVFVQGRVRGRPSVDLSKLSGHAYMSGSDTWVDVPRMMGLSFTQPDKVHLTESDDPLWTDALEVLRELERVLEDQYEVFREILLQAKSGLNEDALGYLEELVDCVEILSLRAAFNHKIYQSQDPATPPARKTALLLESRSTLYRAGDIMQRRADNFRVPVDRIAGWRQNPTVYPYGYVWAAKSLYYWWRDQGIAELQSDAAGSPCYLNRMEPLELVVGWGKALEQAIRLALKAKGKESNETTVAAQIADCFAPPLMEFRFPRDL